MWHPRRLLAYSALSVSVLALLLALFAPITKSTPAPTADPLPVLCSACGASAPAWLSAEHPPLIPGPSGTQRVNPNLIAAAASEPPPDHSFGVVEAYVSPYVASYAGVGWERLIFDWPSLQPTGPTSWNRAAVNGAMISREIAAGREVIGIIGGRPSWAITKQGIPQGLYLPPNDPHNYWGAFVANLVQRYRGRIHDWIIWNEPDVWDPHNGGYTWPGSVDDFARLQKVAYVQIKRVDPTLVVHLAATTYWWDAAYGRPLYLARLLDALAKDPDVHKHNWYFDVASAHIYNVPDDVERILGIDHNLMRAHGFDKPIWLVETNAMPTDDGPWAMIHPRWLATADEQSSFVIQATALALAAGASRVSIYKMADPAGLSLRAYPVGLVRPDGSARPVVAALRVTTHAFAGWTAAHDLGSTNSVRAVSIEKGSHGHALVLWTSAPSNTTVQVSVPISGLLPAARFSDMVQVIAANDTVQQMPISVKGRTLLLTLTLTGSTCARSGLCNIGGSPLIILAPTLPALAG